MSRSRLVGVGVVGLVVSMTALVGCGSSDSASTESADASGGAAASGASGGGVPDLGTLRFVYGAPPEVASSAAPFAVALANGYWADQGLTVDIKGLAGGPAAVQALITGQGDVSVSGTSTMLTTLAAGDPLPIKEFFSWIVEPTYAVSVPADSPIQSIEDLKGLPIGVENLGKDDAIALTNILSIAQGVDKSEINLVPVGEGPQALQALKSGQVAAYAGGDTGNAQLNVLGFPVRDLPLPQALEGATDTVFVTTPEYLSGHQAQLAAFGRGVAQAEVFCQANMDACIKTYWKQYPKAAPPNADSDFAEASKVIRASMTTRLPKLAPVDGKWGYQTEDGLAAMGTVQGLADVKSLDLASLFTNEMVDQFNDFDESAVKAQATSFTG